MDENTAIFVKFGFNEGDTRNEVVHDILFLDIVNFDLFVSEGLVERSGLPGFKLLWRNTDALDDYLPPHSGENAVNVVFLEI